MFIILCSFSTLCLFLFTFLTITSASSVQRGPKRKYLIREDPMKGQQPNPLIERNLFISWPVELDQPSRLIVEKIEESEVPGETISVKVANLSLNRGGSVVNTNARIVLRYKGDVDRPFRFCLAKEDGTVLTEMVTQNSWAAYLRSNTCPHSKLTYLKFTNESTIVGYAQYNHPFAGDKVDDQ